MEYNLIRRKRQKHINIRVHHNGQVTVSAPRHTGIDRIREAVALRQEWISRHVEEALTRLDSIDELSSIIVGGITYSVIVEYDASRRGWVKISHDDRTIRLRSASRSTDVRKTELIRFLKRHSRKTMTVEVLSHAKSAGIAIERIFFRDQKTRWGSSSARGNISLNWRIVLLPDPIRRYLILHELAHQVHMNHSPKFWGKVASLCPDYAECDRWLKNQSYILGLFR